jgi:hypothetical protein
MQDRRRVDRHLKSLEFSCTVDGKLFEAQSLDLSAGGAFMAANALVPTGATARIVPAGAAPSGPEPGLFLHGLVVRQQRSPVNGVALQWLKCESSHGLEPLKGFLGDMLGVDEGTIATPPPHVAAMDQLEYDFVLQEVRPGRTQAAGWDGAQTSDGAHLGWRMNTPAGGIPVAPQEEVEADDFADDKTEPEERSLVYRPTSVEVYAGVERINAVVHSQGAHELLLAVAGDEPIRLADVTVVYPVPAKGQKLFIEIECHINSAEPMEGVDAVAHDLTIRRFTAPGASSLWGRWITHLFERHGSR